MLSEVRVLISFPPFPHDRVQSPVLSSKVLAIGLIQWACKPQGIGHPFLHPDNTKSHQVRSSGMPQAVQHAGRSAFNFWGHHLVVGSEHHCSSISWDVYSNRIIKGYAKCLYVMLKLLTSVYSNPLKIGDSYCLLNGIWISSEHPLGIACVWHFSFYIPKTLSF